MLWGVLARTDVFLPNETEACAITGAADPLAALNIPAQRVPTVALKRGSAGSSAQRAGETVCAPALLVDAVDTTGAGESFDGGFLYGVLRGRPLEDCLRLANARGALSTRCRGGTDGQPTPAEAASYAGLPLPG